MARNLLWTRMIWVRSTAQYEIVWYFGIHFASALVVVSNFMGCRLCCWKEDLGNAQKQQVCSDWRLLAGLLSQLIEAHISSLPLEQQPVVQNACTWLATSWEPDTTDRCACSPEQPSIQIDASLHELLLPVQRLPTITFYLGGQWLHFGFLHHVHATA